MIAPAELAHGSNVAGLETTATFDERSDEFVIHTPSVSATKWWIGGAAHSATHSAVFARLIVKGMDYGTKTFVVPLRNPKTYQLLPGIAIGDIGCACHPSLSFVRSPPTDSERSHCPQQEDGPRRHRQRLDVRSIPSSLLGDGR